MKPNDAKGCQGYALWLNILFWILVHGDAIINVHAKLISFFFLCPPAASLSGAVCSCCDCTENPRVRARGARQIRTRSRGDRGASRGGSQTRNVTSERQISSLPCRARVHQEGGSASGEEAHRDWRHQAEAEDIASKERAQP